jgi:hypothetical protein
MTLTVKRITFVILMVALLSLFVVEAATGVMSGWLKRNTPVEVVSNGGHVDPGEELPPIDAVP